MKGYVKPLIIYLVLAGNLLPVISTFAADSLRVGIIPYKSEKVFDATFNPLLSYLGETLGQEVIIYKVEKDELAYGLDQGQFDIGIFRPFAFLEAHEDFPELRVFGSHVVRGAEIYEGGIVVKKNSGIGRLQDLNGKDFLFVKPTSTSGFRYPKGIFKEQGIDIDKEDFFNKKFAGGHIGALMALAHDEVDGVAIDLVAFDKAGEVDKAEFNILHTYEVPYPAYVFSPKLDTNTQESLREIFFNAHKTPAGRPLFANNPLGIERWVPQEDDYYNSLRHYLDFSRVKPRIGLEIHFSKKVREQHVDEDFLEQLSTDILYAFEQANHFRVDTIRQPLPQRRIVIDISTSRKKYRCDVRSNHNSLGEEPKKRILTESFSFEDLESIFPSSVAQATFRNHSITTPLITDGTDWFISYGTNDGIDLENFTFLVSNGKSVNGGVNQFQAEPIRVGERKVYFEEEEEFSPHQMLEIKFKGDLIFGNSESLSDSRPWWNDGNNWDIFGVLLAILTIVAGAYFSRRKRRRFQSMLYESNALLKEYVEDTYNLENRLIEQKEKISQSLSKGYITENQFLILKHRLEDVEMVINNLLQVNSSFPPQVEEEISTLLANHQLSEKDYSRIISLVKKNSTKSEQG